MAYVALYQNHEYLVGYFTENGTFAQEWNMRLPTIFKGQVDESVMSKIPNLGYSENEYEYSIWDKRINETEELAVPVYAKVFNEYKYTGKTYTFKVPTSKTLEAAKKIVDMVYAQMELEIYAPGIKKLEELLQEGKGICFVKSFDISNVSLICELTGKEELWSGKHQHIVGDPSMVTSIELNLYVPEKIMPIIIGKGGKNIKEMAAKMRVNKIYVLPLEKKSGE